MMRIVGGGIALALVASLTMGCGDDKKPAGAGDGKDAKAATSASATPPDPEKVDVKTEVDFEDEADEKITPDTLDDQVDKLAAEIEADTE